MVMWDLRRYVVEDVSLRNSVCEDATEPAEEWTSATEKRAVEGGERTTLEVECGAAVVREVGVSVLEEGDQNEPVVDPEVRDTVDAGHLQEPTGHRPVDKSTNPEENTDVTDDDLVVLVGSENHRGRPEVVGRLGVVGLASTIPDKIHRPSEEQSQSAHDGSADWGISERVPHLRHDLFRDMFARDVLSGGVERRQVEL